MDEIGVVVGWASEYGLQALAGVTRYARQRGGWQLRTRLPSIFAALPDDLRQWAGRGVIAHINTPELRSELTNLDLPVVNIASWAGAADLPTVRPDHAAAGALAAEDLVTRGLRVFAYAGSDQGFSRMRFEAFSQALAARGQRLSGFIAMDEDADSVAKALLQLPRPVGVLAANDAMAMRMLEACESAGLVVPRDVAVLGVNNEALSCDLARPSLSSIDLDLDRVGYEAAALLDELLQGASPPKEPVLIRPRGVVTRQSTDIAVLDDADVERALHWIRTRYHEPVTIEDLLTDLAVSRRTLERRFRAALGLSPAAELRRARLAHVQTLLAETFWPMSQIARAAGFTDASYMATVFRRETGQSPSDYRRQMQRPTRYAPIDRQTSAL